MRFLLKIHSPKFRDPCSIVDTKEKKREKRGEKTEKKRRAKKKGRKKKRLKIKRWSYLKGKIKKFINKSLAI